MANSAAHKPSELEAQYSGQVRTGTGYQYWTTSEEDEVSVDSDLRQKEARGEAEAGEVEEVKVKKKRDFRALKTLIKRIAQLVLVGLVVAIGYVIFTFVQVYGAASDDETQAADAVVVLGAAQFDGTPSPIFQGRLDHAYNLWKNGQVSQIVTTGSKQEGDRVTEGYAGLVYLLEKGVPAGDIVTIIDGENTWEQLSASAVVIEDENIESVLLVSDGYHNYRLLGIADEVGIDQAFVSPTAVRPTMGNYLRETAAVSVGRLFGYRRLSSLTSEAAQS